MSDTLVQKIQKTELRLENLRQRLKKNEKKISPPINKRGAGKKATTMVKYAMPNNIRDWKVEHAGGGFDNVKFDKKEDATIVNLKKGGFAAGAGVNLKCEVDEIFPAKHIKFSYKVYVPDNFDAVKGGKFPGITLNGGCGGRDWQKDRGSVRIMFRREGQLVAYLYLPTNQGDYNGGENCKLMKNQGKCFRENCHHTNGAGLDMFRNLPKKDQLRLENGKWNDITLHLKLNDAGKNNGILEMSVNGKTHTIDDMMYSSDPDKTPFKFYQHSVWFGGGDKSYAPGADTELKFKEIQFEKLG